jgi:hypothetical protein
LNNGGPYTPSYDHSNKYLIKSANYYAPHYVIFSLLLVLPSPSGPNILNTLFPNALNLCSSLRARDQVPHPYKTAVLYILIFWFTDTDGKETNVAIEWLALLLLIREVLGKNLGPTAGHPD